ncbi:MAG: hypothetical protein IJA69_03620 [Clostridia bacterium]|nr:hypothetical protein [Clostridia bacterium]
MDEIIEKIKKIGSKQWIFENKHAKKTIKGLMKYYATLYYEGVAKIPDSDFEVLVQTLKCIDKNDKYLLTPGWGYKIRFGKKHIYGKVDTIAYTFDYNILADSFKDKEIVITPKFDGLNVVCYFRNGKMSRLISRGNGYVGKNVSWAYNNFFDISNKNNFAINCEAICVNNQGSNCRDYVASYLNKKKNIDELVCLMPFGILNCDLGDYVKEIQILNSYSQNKVPYFLFDKLPSKQQLFELYNQFKTKFQIDGLVITSNDKSTKMAFKYEII